MTIVFVHRVKERREIAKQQQAWADLFARRDTYVEELPEPEPPPSITVAPPTVNVNVNFDAKRQLTNKTVTTRRDADGKLMADIIETSIENLE